MKPRISIAIALASMGLTSILVAGPASSTSCRANVPSLARESVVAVSDNSLVALDSGSDASAKKMLDSCGERMPLPTGGMLRHPVSQAAVGFAYVLDRAGSDDVVLATDQGIRRMSAAGEVVHPDLSTRGELAWIEDFKDLKILSTNQRRVETVPMPERATALFSPTFMNSERIVAVAQEPANGVPAEDDGLNNLWSHSDTSGWKRLTDFDGDERHWSVIRTPVAASDGTVYFVRVTGDARATRQPSFSLWKVAGGSAAKLRDLPTEMYLAGATDEGLLWNAAATSCPDWGLFAQTDDGFVQVGCGAVTADPLSTVDPDVAVHRESPGSEVASVEDARVGVAIGDFGTRAAAAAVARRVGASFPARVADHRRAPDAVRPGATSVIVPAPGDGITRLEAVRSRFPALGTRTWIVPLP